ncbi:GntR family transcriptional regulator [Jiangella anatolica]|uniref:GntR family transcriptional regulator n=1 Tax=Jiangella anatolica TaxID=2670374 RepID=A0A2W2BYK0_9ACTN|nr:winged helix-turn-helix domain-containing protein [Jiangella anatolica]PZF81129.1 GntR family transcriptional regulator [Jiangella anatolica]
MPAFDPDPDLPGYSYVRFADFLAGEIASGRIPVGGKLPGEIELARTHKVALGTVRRAMVVLRERGLVATYPSKGSFVTGRGAES